MKSVSMECFVSQSYLGARQVIGTCVHVREREQEGGGDREN